MPTYEFVCVTCKRKFEKFLSYREYGKVDVYCPFCLGKQVKRTIGRIRMAKTEESRLENLADPSTLDKLSSDPQSMGRMMRSMSSEMGDDLGPEYNEVIGRLEKGQSLEQIEKELPDLGEGEIGNSMENSDF